MVDQLSLAGYGYRAVVDCARGARLTELGSDGLSAWSVRGAVNGADSPFFCGTPLLFPPNRIAGGAFRFHGRTYALPVNEPRTGCHIHGALHEAPFATVARDTLHAELRYHAEAGEYLGFPHAFTLRVLYSLGPDGLRQQAVIRNESGLVMPFALGWHTTFALPFASGGSLEDVSLMLDVAREYPRQDYLPTWEARADTPLIRSLTQGNVRPAAETLSAHFSQGATHEMRLRDRRVGVEIRYITPDYGYWLLYNGGRTDLLCVEPQTCVVNAGNAPWPYEQSGLIALAPGEERAFSAQLQICGME